MLDRYRHSFVAGLVVLVVASVASPVVSFVQAAEDIFSGRLAMTPTVADASGVRNVAVDVVGQEVGVSPASGKTMIRLQADVDAAERTYVYLKIKDLSYAITAHTRLSYLVYADPSSLDDTFGVDLATPDFYPHNVRDDHEIVDQNGICAHPWYGTKLDYDLGRWYYREIPLSRQAGRTATAAYIGWGGGGGATGHICGYFCRIVLWEDGSPPPDLALLRATYGGDLPAEALDTAAYRALPPVSDWQPLDPRVERQSADAASPFTPVCLGPNGYFRLASARGAAPAPYLPFGLFGSEIHTDLRDGVFDKVGRILWWSHVPWAGAEGNNSEPAEIAPEDWDRYFAFCAARGITSLRLFTYGYTTPPGQPGYYFSLDAIGKVHPVLWAKLDKFMSAGFRHGIRFLFTVIASPDWEPYVTRSRPDSPPDQCLDEAIRQYTPGEVAGLPPYRKRFLIEKRAVDIKNAYDNAPFFADPDIARCIEDYLTDLLPRLKDDPRIFALEIMNETFPVSNPGWAAKHVTPLVRKLCPGTPLTISHTFGSEVAPYETLPFARAAGLDFYNWHSYLAPNHPVTMELAINSKFFNAGMPGMPTEGPAYYGGMKADQIDNRQRRLEIRDYLWLPLACGCPGSILWSPENSDAQPWDWEELRILNTALGQIAARIDFTSFRREKPEIGLATSLRPALRSAYSRRCLRMGVDFDFADRNAGYRLWIDKPIPIADLRPCRRPVVAPGHDCVTALLGEGLRQMLIYLPNYTANARGSAKRNVELLLDLPDSAARATIFDLDTLTLATATVRDKCRLPVARESADDFVVMIAR